MFEPVTEELICRLISQSPTKSCTLDPIPTTLTNQCLHDLAPLVTRIVSFFVHWHCPIWVKADSCDNHTEETGSWCQWFKKFQTSLKSPIRFEDTIEGSSSSTAVSSVRKQLTRNSTVCVQKISQYRNCYFACTRRPPYKVWSETCVNTCTVGSECCFWQPWSCHPIKTTWEHLWNFGISAVLVRVIPQW